MIENGQPEPRRASRAFANETDDNEEEEDVHWDGPAQLSTLVAVLELNSGGVVGTIPTCHVVCCAADPLGNSV